MKLTSERLEIKFGGMGGQGVVYAANLLGLGLSYQKGYVAVSASYGPESRGSLTSSEVVFSPKPIDYPYAEGIDIFVAMHQEAYDRYAKKVRKDGIVLIDASLVRQIPNPKSQFRSLCRLPASDIAQSQTGDTTMANLILLGGLIQLVKLISPNQCIKALKEFTTSRFYPINLKALKIGLNYQFR